jgi:hypothetical protein
MSGVLRARLSAATAGISCKRKPAVGGSPESPHGASSRHGAKLAESACGDDVDARSSRAARADRPQQQEACWHSDPHLQTWA